MVELHCGAATDTGLVRATNQDAFLAAAPVFVVADGMGGHAGGEVASGIVIEEFTRMVLDGYDETRALEVVTEVLAESQRRIRAYADRHRGAGDPDWYSGTTVVAALLCHDDEGSKWLLVNLGDSRIYRLHEGALEQVSVDHSVVQELVDSGEIEAASAATHPDRHVVTRALGGPGLVQPDFFVLPLGSATRVVLCSDGVSGMIGDAEIRRILAEAPDPRDAADRMVGAALAAGGEDNATAVVVDVVGLTGTERPEEGRRSQVSLEEKLGALP
jgi:PPM family protein phosphatase